MKITAFRTPATGRSLASGALASGFQHSQNGGGRRRPLYIFLTVLLVVGASEAICRVAEHQIMTRRSLDLPAKREGEYRIFTFGGSTVAGFPVEKLGFVEQMKYRIQKGCPGRDVTIYNLADPGKDSSGLARRVSENFHNFPDLLILLSGHNEFLSRRIKPYYAEFLMSQGIFGRIAIIRMIRYGVARVRGRRFGIFEKPATVDYESEFRAVRKDLYRKNIRNIVEMTRQRGVGLMLCTVAANLRDWPPAFRHPMSRDTERRAFEAAVAECLRLIDGAAVEEARQVLSSIDEKYRKEPVVDYLRGRIHFLQGNYLAASVRLSQARERDPIPWRVLGEFNRYLRRISEEQGVWLVDIEKAFREAAPHGLPGSELFGDHCHPTPEGNALIAERLVAAIAESGLIAHREEWTLFPSDGADYLASIRYHETPYGEKLDYHIKSSQICAMPPFYNFEASCSHLDAAIRINARFWPIWVQFGTIEMYRGNREKALEYLRKAGALKGTPLDVAAIEGSAHLVQVLKASGLDPASLATMLAEP